jgi:hypothetical protein
MTAQAPSTPSCSLPFEEQRIDRLVARSLDEEDPLRQRDDAWVDAQLREDVAVSEALSEDRAPRGSCSSRVTSQHASWSAALMKTASGWRRRIRVQGIAEELDQPTLSTRMQVRVRLVDEDPAGLGEEREGDEMQRLGDACSAHFKRRVQSSAMIRCNSWNSGASSLRQ